MADFYIKSGDTLPSLEATLKDALGTPVNISGSTVKFNMRRRNSATAKVSSSAVVADGPNGVVRYEWDTADTNEAGEFEGEFEVTFASGDVETFPNYRHLDISILGAVN